MSRCHAFLCPYDCLSDWKRCLKGFRTSLMEISTGARAASIVFEPGQISEKEKLVWQKEGRRIYLRCPCCFEINRIGSRDVNDQGLVRVHSGFWEHAKRDCVTCPECRAHFYPELHGWKPTVRRKRRSN